MAGDEKPGSIAQVIKPAAKDLGEFTVRRSLPDRNRQRVGPFIFWDHMGPADFRPGTGVAVRPHPHIGLATITYLFDGVIMHRDSLGYEQAIEPGAVNWMTAGRGIVHSERSPAHLLEAGSHLHGIQAWLALPKSLEETDPRFEHYPADRMPRKAGAGVRITVIAGEAYGERSPVQTSSETLYVDLEMSAGSEIETPPDFDEVGVYNVSGAVEVDGFSLAEGTMAVLADRTSARLTAAGGCRVMLLGGGTLEGERHLWWNFVSSSRERIAEAKRDWREGKFPEVPGDPEFIPLPKK